ncbi:homoserine O-acetyltransferase [Planctomycetales bacterium ZRK34]|nr:homoserine O-acetyltransferase [Planctomycetales bacterium ZRK34]
MEPQAPFTSSDDARTARPLRHLKSYELSAPLSLERGGELPEVTVAYETYGQLNAARDNAILICHALSGDSHVAAHDADDDPGWWDLVVGPGKAIDTDRYFVVCPNVLGGCRGTTGPNFPNPATGKPYGADFPLITVGDIVETQKQLVDHLGIDRLHAVIGGSLGGHMTLTWARRFPERVDNAVALATCARLNSQSLAFDVVGRNAILLDPNYRGGQYYQHDERPSVGLAIARMLGHITYLSREAMTDKFDPDRHSPRRLQTAFETHFSVGSYLAYQSDRFVERFDANSYLTLTMAMDLFDLGATTDAIAASLAPSTCRWLVLSFSSDWLFPPAESRAIVDALIALRRSVSYCEIQTKAGHDAFLLEDELDLYGEMIRAFLDVSPHDEIEHAAEPDSPSIFNHRVDYDSIVDLLEPDASVLDLGCGNGELLARLRARGHDPVQGIELSQRAVRSCLQRGLDVVRRDINDGLAPFADQQFDYVILSHTIQAMTNVQGLLRDMLRVGRRCIVSFPNIAFRKLREQLHHEGRAPRSSALTGPNWYETSSIRFLSLLDFEDYCRDQNIDIIDRVALDTEQNLRVDNDPNLNADVVVLVIAAH